MTDFKVGKRVRMKNSVDGWRCTGYIGIIDSVDDYKKQNIRVKFESRTWWVHSEDCELLDSSQDTSFKQGFSTFYRNTK